MNRLTLGILSIALIMGFIGWLRFQNGFLKLKLEAEQQAFLQSQKELDAALHSVENLLALNQQKDRQAKALEQQQQALQKQYEQQKQQLSEVHHAPENKEWATTDLPSAIKQLRNRPRMYSASDYHQYLQHTQPLPTARNSTNNE